jgi:DNA-binding response OmpR family regulator
MNPGKARRPDRANTGDDDMKPKRILIADDDDAILAAIRTRLEAEGFEVLTAQDGYQALAMARTARPDLLVLDINMPAGSGFSVHERLAKIDGMADTPIIFITGETADTIRHEAIAHGVTSVIHKPFQRDELVEAARASLGFWVTRRPAGHTG